MQSKQETEKQWGAPVQYGTTTIQVRLRGEGHWVCRGIRCVIAGTGIGCVMVGKSIGCVMVGGALGVSL